MALASETEIAFVRLTEIPLAELSAHMGSSRVTEHLPLATGSWDLERCQTFVRAKEEYWQRDGLGHWGITYNGSYAGWGGFQKEAHEWDFGLVLTPEHFGKGLVITRRALEFARSDARIPFVTFLLAPTRKHLRGLERLGAAFCGEVEYAGETFLKFRLETLGS